MSTHGSVAIIGGTGPQGRGLGYRLARAGVPVIIGSRSANRAAVAAAQIRALPGLSADVHSLTNVDAAASAQTVILAVPYTGHRELISELAPKLTGRTLISCVNPLGFDKAGPYGLSIEAGSAAEEAAALVPDATVVAAFHHLAAPRLLDPGADLSHEDILVCGDDTQAKQHVIALASAATGGRGVDAGLLRLARQLEPLTALLISINKKYHTHAGVSLTGLPFPTAEGSSS